MLPGVPNERILTVPGRRTDYKPPIPKVRNGNSYRNKTLNLCCRRDLLDSAAKQRNSCKVDVASLTVKSPVERIPRQVI